MNVLQCCVSQGGTHAIARGARTRSTRVAAIWPSPTAQLPPLRHRSSLHLSSFAALSAPPSASFGGQKTDTRHQGFPIGPPHRYWLGDTALICGERTGSGGLTVLWSCIQAFLMVHCSLKVKKQTRDDPVSLLKRHETNARTARSLFRTLDTVASSSSLFSSSFAYRTTHNSLGTSPRLRSPPAIPQLVALTTSMMDPNPSVFADPCCGCGCDRQSAPADLHNKANHRGCCSIPCQSRDRVDQTVQRPFLYTLDG